MLLSLADGGRIEGLFPSQNVVATSLNIAPGQTRFIVTEFNASTTQIHQTKKNGN
jgi:hypothetical protein